MVENFSSHPQSIGEIKSDKTQRAQDWSPRDALISILRDIDEGRINPNVMVICYATVEGDESNTNFACSAPNPLMSWGVLTRVAYRMNRSGEE